MANEFIPTFPIFVARMMSEGVPKGWTSLMMSLSDQPLSGSPVINRMPFCRKEVHYIRLLINYNQ